MSHQVCHGLLRWAEPAGSNYRWDYLSEELEIILKLGVVMRTQVANGTTLGRAVAAKFLVHERGRERRRRK